MNSEQATVYAKLTTSSGLLKILSCHIPAVEWRELGKNRLYMKNHLSSRNYHKPCFYNLSSLVSTTSEVLIFYSRGSPRPWISLNNIAVIETDVDTAQNFMGLSKIQFDIAQCEARERLSLVLAHL